MPTPRPIIVATSGVNSGVDMNRAITPMRLTAIPMPSSAVAIGSPMATTDPKATSSTTMAASRPRPSLEGMVCGSNQGLAKATSSPWPASGLARSLRSATAVLRTASLVFSSVKEAVATLPLMGEISSGWTTGPAGEVGLQEVVGLLGVGAGQTAVGGPDALEGGSGADGQNQQADPGEQDETPAVIAAAGETSEHGSSKTRRQASETILRGLSRQADPRT